jgi:hypothetical protein
VVKAPLYHQKVNLMGGSTDIPVNSMHLDRATETKDGFLVEMNVTYTLPQPALLLSSEAITVAGGCNDFFFAPFTVYLFAKRNHFSSCEY